LACGKKLVVCNWVLKGGWGKGWEGRGEKMMDPGEQVIAMSELKGGRFGNWG